MLGMISCVNWTRSALYSVFLYDIFFHPHIKHVKLGITGATSHINMCIWPSNVCTGSYLFLQKNMPDFWEKKPIHFNFTSFDCIYCLFLITHLWIWLFWILRRNYFIKYPCTSLLSSTTVFHTKGSYRFRFNYLFILDLQWCWAQLS